MLSSLFRGDFNIECGPDIQSYGYGNLSVHGDCTINGTSETTSVTSGSMILHGGLGISKNAILGQDITVNGHSKLFKTSISTDASNFNVTGGNGVVMSVGSGINLSSTSSSVILNSPNSFVSLQSGLSGDSAISLAAQHIAGGMRLSSGYSGNINIAGGSVNVSTSTGNLNLTCNSKTDNQNLSMILTGDTDSKIEVVSSGNDDAILVQTTHTSGSIVIKNAIGDGGVSVLTGGAGFSVLTSTYGNVEVKSQSATSTYSVQSNNNNQNMTIALSGNTDSGVIITSDGVSASNPAVKIQTTHTSGNIEISQTAGSSGTIKINSGSSGFLLNSKGKISLIGGVSDYQCVTTDDFQDLTIKLSGDTDSKLVLESSGTSNSAISIKTTVGGVNLYSYNDININSESGNINIATNNNAPVNIGTGTTNCTIHGNLIVEGLTTTVESQTMVVSDNIIQVNNSPSGISDGGIAIQRYQTENDVGLGEVILDTPKDQGTLVSGNLSSCVLKIGSSTVSGWYNDWWIFITAGTGFNQVRKISDYVGSTQVASVITNFTTIPDSTSTYALYNYNFAMNIFDESLDEFAFIYSSGNPSKQVIFDSYANVHLKNLTCNSISTSFINGGVSDTITTVTLDNNSTTPVTITNFPITFGIATVYVQASTESQRASGIFVVGKVNYSTEPGSSNRLISVRGAHGDMLDIQWPISGKPQLLYRPVPSGISGTCIYTLKIIRAYNNLIVRIF